MDEYPDNAQLRKAVLREIYNRRNAPAGIVSGNEVAQSVGVPVESSEFDEAVTDLVTRRHVTRKSGNAMLSITAEGIAEMEPKSAAATQSFTFNAPAYGIFGSQQHFRFEQVIRDLDHQIEEHGGADKEELREMVQEIQETLENQDSITRSKFERWSGLANKHLPWLLQPLGSLLINYVFGAGNPR